MHGATIKINNTKFNSEVGKFPDNQLVTLKVCVLSTEFCVTFEYKSAI